jgi:murein DD-endopeptidase MepM/ murein hydrolase activator NlpD
MKNVHPDNSESIILSMSWRSLLWIIIAGVLLGLGIYLYRSLRPTAGRSTRLMEWLREPQAHPEWTLHAGTRCRADAPFLFPTDGFIGYLWDDSFRLGHRHQGIDIFGGTAPGKTPVVAAYPGYLTRLPDWKSAVIVRLPEDPLQPGRQIWLYYTHMADSNGNSFIMADFPAGTREKIIQAGTLLGYQGNYTGDATNPTGVHLHFSIVLSAADGNFLNELEIRNTLDPSPYFGLPLNARTAPDEVTLCDNP